MLKDLNKKEVHELIEKTLVSMKAIEEEDYWDGSTCEEWFYGDEVHNGVLINEVETHGGEGQGDEYWIVWKIQNSKDENDYIHFRMQGYYSSYNGTDWDGSEIELVKEVEVMRTEWVGV